MIPPVLTRHLVLQTEHLSAPAAAWLAEQCDLRVCPHDSSEFARLLPAAHALIVRTYTIVDAAMLERAPNLKVVGRAGVGLDNIDLAACRARGVRVVHTPDANTQAVVEYVLALLADAWRPRTTLNHSVSAAEWNCLRETTVGRRQMDELSLGILGMGRVGRRLAQVAGAIGFRVRYHDLAVIPPEVRHGAQPVDLHSVMGCDVVSLHIDGRPSNRMFVNASLISRLDPQVVLINTSRGMVIDHRALATFLRANPEALAMLDVHDPEPIGDDHPLLGLPNARLYPHLASRTETAMENMSWVVRDVMAVLGGDSPKFEAPEEAAL